MDYDGLVSPKLGGIRGPVHIYFSFHIHGIACKCVLHAFPGTILTDFIPASIHNEYDFGDLRSDFGMS